MFIIISMAVAAADSVDDVDGNAVLSLDDADGNNVEEDELEVGFVEMDGPSLFALLVPKP